MPLSCMRPASDICQGRRLTALAADAAAVAAATGGGGGGGAAATTAAAAAVPLGCMRRASLSKLPGS